MTAGPPKEDLVPAFFLAGRSILEGFNDTSLSVITSVFLRRCFGSEKKDPGHIHYRISQYHGAN